MQLEEAKPSEQGGFDASEIESKKVFRIAFTLRYMLIGTLRRVPISIGLEVSNTTSFASSWVIDSGATDHMTHLSHLEHVHPTQAIKSCQSRC